MKPKHSKPTLASIARALKLSVRRVSQLRAAGMPVDTIDNAKKWRSARTTTGPDSPEALRRERILLVAAQRQKVETENRRAAGELVESAAAMESATAVCAATRSALMMLTHSLPPQLVGLSETKIARVLRVEFTRILSAMSEGRFFNTPEVAAIIEAAKREARN